MKKNIILGIIIALLIVAVAVESFFLWKQNSDKNKEEGKGETEQVEQTPSPEPTELPEDETPLPEPTQKPIKLPNDETLDGEKFKISKKYSNPKGNELVYTYLTVTVEEKRRTENQPIYEYKYEIPQINLESKEIEKINKEILEKYENIIDKVNKEQFIDLENEALYYEYYENNGILSLVMINPTEAGGYFNCETYNIDVDYYFTSTQKGINNKELLEKIGINEKDLNKKINKAIENLTMYNEDIVEGKKVQDLTINKYKNVSADEVTLYLNNKGNLCAYLEVYGVVGGEFTTVIVDLKTEKGIEIKEKNMKLID